MHIHERLALARTRAGFTSAAAAAESLGVNRYTYSQHENGTRGFKREAAAQYARRFGVSLTWLLTGRTEPTTPGRTPVLGHVGAGATVTVASTDSPTPLDQVETPPGMAADGAAVIVRGDSMYPTCEDGDVLFYDNRTPDVAALLNRLCIVWLGDDRVLIKRLRRGAAKGRFTLESANVNMPPIEDAAVVSAAPVLWIKRRF
jgi:phage repressor protein C with HTH and peptisase S24 domain